jgi:DNA repair protein SbcC/Rad50
MSLFSNFKAIMRAQGRPQNALSPQEVAAQAAQAAHAAALASKQAHKDALAQQLNQAQWQLDALTLQVPSEQRDAQLVAFAAASQHADQRWEAVQAVGAGSWAAVLAQVAPRDRRIAKWVREQLQAHKAVGLRDAAWQVQVQGFEQLMAETSVDVQHFVARDKAYEAAHVQHGFDAAAQAQVSEWRSALQARLQVQNDAQRHAQAQRDTLRAVLESVERGNYDAALQARFDAAAADQARVLTDLPAAHGLFAIARLHTEIKTLLPQAQAAIDRASGIAQREQTEQQRAAKALDKASAQASAAQRHAKAQAWLAPVQAQLAAALEHGHGQEAVTLAQAIVQAIDANDTQPPSKQDTHSGKHTPQTVILDLKQLPADQAAALDRLLAQARETRSLLWEGAALERGALIAKALALADKPLVGKFQEAAVKALNEAWKALNAKSGGAPTAVYLQFKAACDAAYAPVKTHKAGMKQVMAQGTAQRQALIDELTALLAQVDWATVDWRGVEDLRREARAQWRSNLPSEYKHRDALTKAHDAIMQQLDTQLDSARQRELARRAALTQAAVALQTSTQAFPEQHAAARELMTRYNAERSTVYLPRELDSAAWNTFKAAVDAVYARRDSERKAEQADQVQALSALLASKQAVLNGLQAAQTELAGDAKKLANAITQAQTDWDAQGRLPRNVPSHDGVDIAALVQQWLSTVDAAQAQVKALNHRAQFAKVAQALALATALDTGAAADIHAAWATAQQDKTVKKAFDARVQAAVAGQAAAVNAPAVLGALLNAEIACHTDSPAAYKDARLKLQVQRLSDKLTGNTASSADAGFAAWLTALTLAGSTQGEAGQRLQAIARKLNP